jgi:hypothetical protein
LRRAGKQVRNAKQALVCPPLGEADQLAVVGDNGKLLVSSPLPNSRKCSVASSGTGDGDTHLASLPHANRGLVSPDA